MHVGHIEPRSLEWTDAMLDETKPGFEAEGEEVQAVGETESRQSLAPPTPQRSIGLSAPSR